MLKFKASTVFVEDEKLVLKWTVSEREEQSRADFQSHSAPGYKYKSFC